MKKSVLLVMCLALILTLAACGAKPAEPVSPISSVTPANFAQALAADKLQLKPLTLSVRIEEKKFRDELMRVGNAATRLGSNGGALYTEAVMYKQGAWQRDASGILYVSIGQKDGLPIISMSPDGTKFLLRLSASLLGVWDDTAQALRAVAPGEACTEDNTRALAANIRNPEEPHIVWSRSGQYIALAYPEAATKGLVLDQNLLLIDVGAGTIQPIVEMPAMSSIVDFKGMPVRAVFDPQNETLLYYEMYAVSNTPVMQNELRSYDIKTGATRTVLTYDGSATPTDPAIVLTARGFIMSYWDTRSEQQRGSGLIIRPRKGEATELAANVYTADSAPQSVCAYRLLDASGGKALLRFDPTVGPEGMKYRMLMGIAEVSLDATREQALEQCAKLWRIHPDQPAASRLERADAAQMLADFRTSFEPMTDTTPMLVKNAATFADGRFVLLSHARAQGGRNALYMLDRQTDACGQVDISLLGLEEKDLFGLYNSAQPWRVQGLRWGACNRILVQIGLTTNYQLFELTVMP